MSFSKILRGLTLHKPHPAGRKMNRFVLRTFPYRGLSYVPVEIFPRINTIA